MKRVLLSIGASVLGLVALLSFKTHGHPVAAGAALPSAALPAGTASSAPAQPGHSTSAPPNPSPGSPAAGRAAASQVIAGDAIQTQYGVVQVQVSVAGKKITNVAFLQLTAYDGRSQQINNDAAPILLQETLSAQNAHIDTVSGASYTSDGYVRSLQSALDKAGIS
jgi:uncharacterized protein with FMN-binding domain